jgi:hypothetical protein
MWGDFYIRLSPITVLPSLYFAAGLNIMASPFMQ